MADKEEYSKDSRMSSKQTFLQFICNRRTGEFCGRTAGSWAKILIFYIIFYACLAAFWAVMLLIFYQTIDYREPKWQLEESRIGTNPGLGFRPRAPPNKVESTLIWFSNGKPDSYKHAVEDIKKFLTENNETDSTNVADSKQCEADEPLKDKDKYCRFEVSQIASNPCNEDTEYGYKTNKPCILVKLNRIFGWVPLNWKEEKDVPTTIKSVWKPGKIIITCEGENAADKENIGVVKYYPDNGISFKYFPFRNKPGYISPFVWVQFDGTTPGLLVNIECKAWASNIKHDRMDREGSVHFELLID